MAIAATLLAVALIITMPVYEVLACLGFSVAVIAVQIIVAKFIGKK